MKRIAVLLLLLAATAYGATTFTTNYSFNKPGDGDTNYGELIRDNWDKADTQIKANEDSITNHIGDTTSAHIASSIGATAGAFQCTTVDDVQEYLDCLDGVLDPGVSGVVLIAGAQTITGLKTFSLGPIFTNNPTFSAATSGILNTDGAGLVSSSTFDSLDPVTTKGDLYTYDTASTRLAVGTDGQVLVADSLQTTGLKWDDPNPRWTKVTVSYTDLSFAATTSTFSTSITIPPLDGVDALVVRHTTAFSGGGITAYTVQVKEDSGTNYSAPYDVFQATGAQVSQTSQVLDVPDFGSNRTLQVVATSTGADLDQATQGSVDIYLRTFTLP